jgi:hypothetical protein
VQIGCISYWDLFLSCKYSKIADRNMMEDKIGTNPESRF